jgi:hypothetical protein
MQSVGYWPRQESGAASGVSRTSDHAFGSPDEVTVFSAAILSAYSFFDAMMASYS